MNKTLKTVLITLAVVFVLLFALIMAFGEDMSTPASSSSNIEESSSVESQEAPATSSSIEESAQIEASGASSVNNEQESPAAEISKELLQTTLGYDVFDWNMADDQGKVAIAADIIKIWNAGGNVYEMTAKDLAASIDNGMSDQANIFEVACIAAQIDPQPYFEAIS